MKVGEIWKLKVEEELRANPVKITRLDDLVYFLEWDENINEWASYCGNEYYHLDRERFIELYKKDWDSESR